MNFRKTVFLLGLLLGLAMSGPLAWPQDQGILKTYDLSGFFSAQKSTGPYSDRICRLIPFHPHFYLMESGSDTSYDPFHKEALSSIKETLTLFMDQQTDGSEQLSIKAIGEQLYIHASLESHSKIGAFLDFLDSHYNREITLNFRVFHIKEQFPLVSAGTLAAIKDTLEPIYSQGVTLQAGDLFEVQDGVKLPIVWGIDDEIAQKSISCNPEIYPLFLGLDLAARPVILGNSQRILISLCAMMSRLATPLKKKEIAINGALVLEKEVAHQTSSRLIDDPKMEFASVAAHLSLVAGETGYVQVALSHHLGMGGILIAIKPEITPVKNSLSLEGDQVWAVHDLGFLQVSDFMGLDSMDNGNVFKEFDENYDPTFTQMGPRFKTQSESFQDLSIDLVELIEDCRPDLANPMKQTELSLGNLLFIHSSEDYYQAFSKVLHQDRSLISPAMDVELVFMECKESHLHLDGPGILKEGVLRGRIQLPLFCGTQASAIGGFQGLMLEEIDVDVATEASIVNPKTGVYLDGAMVQFKHQPPLSGSEKKGWVHFNIFLNRLDSFKSESHGDKWPLLDKPVLQEAQLRGKVKADGTWRVLGTLTFFKDHQKHGLVAVGKAKAL